MFIGPVFNAEMITSARRARNLVVRVTYASILLMALGMIYSDFNGGFTRVRTVQEYSALASRFFATFSILQLLGVVLIAPALTAGTISVERERRTIEYLFASDLSNWEIVFGKLMAALLRAIALLLVGPPVLALAMLMGGIGPDRLIAVFLITASSLLCVTALAIAISVWSPRARQAMTRTYFYLAVLLLLPPLVYFVMTPGWRLVPFWLQSYLRPVFWMSDQLVQANPFYVTGRVLSAMSRGPAAIGVTTWSLLWPLIRNQGLVTLICIGLAPFAVRRIHLRAAGTSARRRGAIGQRRAIGNHGMLWKELWTERASNHLGTVGRVVLGVVMLALVSVTLWVFFQSPEAGFSAYGYVVGTIIECVMVLLAGMRAADAIGAEKERDTWITLLSTPLEGHEIILSKWLASIYSTRWLFVALWALWFLQAILDPKFLLAIPVLLFSLLLLLGFAAGVGTLFSLWCKNSIRAMGSTLATLIILGGAYIPVGACCCGWMFFASKGPNDDLMMLGMAPCLPYLLAVPHGIPALIEYPNRHVGSPIAAFVLGMMGYALATLVIVQGSIGGFDPLAGRFVLAGHPGYGPPTLPPSPPFMPEVAVIETGASAEVSVEST